MYMPWTFSLVSSLLLAFQVEGTPQWGGWNGYQRFQAPPNPNPVVSSSTSSISPTTAANPFVNTGNPIVANYVAPQTRINLATKKPMRLKVSPASTAVSAQIIDNTVNTNVPIVNQPVEALVNNNPGTATNAAVGAIATSNVVQANVNLGGSASSGGGDGDGNNVTYTCGKGGGGIVIQWTGDPVSFSGGGKSGTTTGCTDFTGFQGQIAIAGTGGSIVEVNPGNYFDVSYILGYSVPVVCSAGGKLSGCNLDLFGNGGKTGQIRKNPTGPGGAHDPGAYTGNPSCLPWCYACSPPDTFFAPCAGTAYTFPYDDHATIGPFTQVTCCIGIGCSTPPNQGSTGLTGNPEPNRPGAPCTICQPSSPQCA